MISIVKLFALAAVTCLMVSPAFAQRGQGRGFRGGRGASEEPTQGRHRGPGFARGGPAGQQSDGHGHDERHAADHEVFQFLLSHHKQIKRTVKELPNGVETLTESDNQEVADKIKDHVHWMAYRIEESNPIRMRDPLFREIFQHADKINLVHEETAGGVRVIETSEDPYVAKLIKAHAKVLSGFVERGFEEAMKNHAVPDSAPNKLEYSNPAIANYGAVVRLPEAAQQPRADTKIVVDLTAGGDRDKLYGSIEKVARYVNIYQGAGKAPTDVQLAVVLHGDATLAALDDDAYATAFGTDGNPNLDCLHELHEAGVQLYVCGQSLVSKGSKPHDVAVFIDPAVSALTALVNLQSDGYRYIPLAK